MAQDLLLKIIVFLIPTQFGLHFWPDFARLNGIKIDYYSPTFYLIDLFIISYLSLNFRFFLKVFQKNQKKAFVFLFVFIFNLWFSLNRPNTFFQFLRFLEYLSLYLIVSQTPNLWKKISKAFCFSLSLVILLQLLQFVFQKSLNGVFYYLGERFFTATSPNLPKINLPNTPSIRVSSLFPHPNSLAGYLLLSFAILKKYKTSFLTKLTNLFSILLTFSKSAYFAILTFFFKAKFNSKIYLIFIVLSLLQLFLPVLHTGIYSMDSRSTMIFNYLNLPYRYFVTGVGLGNYPTALKELLPGSMSTISYLQPIHNLLLLLLVELGVPFTTLLLYLLIKNYNKKYYSVILLVLATGLFDHYWLTLPQNKLIFLLSIALFK